MLKQITIPTCLALAVIIAHGTPVDAQSGPIREGARRTGQAAVDGTRAAVQGSREAIGRAAQTTRNAARATADAARGQTNRAETGELQANSSATADAESANLNAGAQAGPAQVQADADLNGNQSQLDPQGQLNGQAYDSRDQTRYESGFRGTEGQGMNAESRASGQMPAYQQTGQVDYNGRTYRLRNDARGRQFICVEGCPVYLDDRSSEPQAHEAYKMNSDSMQDGYDPQGQQQYRSNEADRSTYAPQNGYGPVPAPPAPVLNDAQDVSPAGPTASTEAAASLNKNLDSSDQADINSESTTETNVDAEADLNSQQDSSADENNESSNSDAESDSNSGT